MEEDEEESILPFVPKIDVTITNKLNLPEFDLEDCKRASLLGNTPEESVELAIESSNITLANFYHDEESNT